MPDLSFGPPPLKIAVIMMSTSLNRADHDLQVMIGGVGWGIFWRHPPDEVNADDEPPPNALGDAA